VTLLAPVTKRGRPYFTCWLAYMLAATWKDAWRDTGVGDKICVTVERRHATQAHALPHHQRGSLALAKGGRRAVAYYSISRRRLAAGVDAVGDGTRRAWAGPFLSPRRARPARRRYQLCAMLLVALLTRDDGAGDVCATTNMDGNVGRTRKDLVCAQGGADLLSGLYAAVAYGLARRVTSAATLRWALLPAAAYVRNVALRRWCSLGAFPHPSTLSPFFLHSLCGGRLSCSVGARYCAASVLCRLGSNARHFASWATSAGRHRQV